MIIELRAWSVCAATCLAIASCGDSDSSTAPIAATAGTGTAGGQAGVAAPAPQAGVSAPAAAGASVPAAPLAGMPAKPPVAGMPPAGASAGMSGAGGATAAGAASVAGAMATAGSAGTPPAATAGAGSTLPPVTDYAQAGPFKTTSTANTGPNSNYTIFRPEPLGADGFLHSPIIFGPGILTTASTYRTLLTHFATHGFVIICVNSMGGGPNDPGNLAAMKTGLDWLIEQNSATGVFQGKLAVERAATMGYSIGATASVQLSSHKAIATSVIIHGHNTKGDPHGPVLMITGTMDVIDDMRQTLTTLEEAPAVLVALPIGHLNVLTEIAASGRYVAPITAWLRYWLNGDQAAKRYFWGDGCDTCKSPWITPEPNAKWKAQML